MIETDAKTRLIYAESRLNMQCGLQEFTLCRCKRIESERDKSAHLSPETIE